MVLCVARLIIAHTVNVNASNTPHKTVQSAHMDAFEAALQRATNRNLIRELSNWVSWITHYLVPMMGYRKKQSVMFIGIVLPEAL